jgi:hypothetical protein
VAHGNVAIKNLQIRIFYNFWWYYVILTNPKFSNDQFSNATFPKSKRPTKVRKDKCSTRYKFDMINARHVIRYFDESQIRFRKIYAILVILNYNPTWLQNTLKYTIKLYLLFLDEFVPTVHRYKHTYIGTCIPMYLGTYIPI